LRSEKQRASDAIAIASNVNVNVIATVTNTVTITITVATTVAITITSNGEVRQQLFLNIYPTIQQCDNGHFFSISAGRLEHPPQAARVGIHRSAVPGQRLREVAPVQSAAPYCIDQLCGGVLPNHAHGGPPEPRVISAGVCK
jgi:hypothetical protein